MLHNAPPESSHRVDAHVAALFERLGATRTAGGWAMPLDAMRVAHRYIGLTLAEMDACLRPLVLVNRSSVTLLDFARILRAANPFDRAQKGGVGVNDYVTRKETVKVYSARPSMARKQHNDTRRDDSPPRPPTASRVGRQRRDGEWLYRDELQQHVSDEQWEARGRGGGGLRALRVEELAGMALGLWDRRNQQQTSVGCRRSPVMEQKSRSVPVASAPHYRAQPPLVPRCASARCVLRSPQRTSSSRATSATRPLYRATMQVESPRLLDNEEEEGLIVEEGSPPVPRFFTRHRQLDSALLIQCELRCRLALLLRYRTLPAARLLQRVGRAAVTRGRMVALRDHSALRQMLLKAHRAHPIHRLAPLPHRAEKEAANRASPVATLQRPFAVDDMIRCVIRTTPASPPGSPPRSSHRRAPPRRKQSPRATSPSSVARSHAVAERLRNDQAARVVTRVIRLAAARGRMRRAHIELLEHLREREKIVELVLIQSHARCNATRYRYADAWLSSRRRSAVRLIRKWWRGRRVHHSFRRRQQALADSIEWRVRFERYYEVVLRCGSWWRYTKGRRQYTVKKSAYTRYNDNRVAFERQCDARAVLVRSGRFFLARLRSTRRVAEVQASNERRVVHERRADAVLTIEAFARTAAAHTLVNTVLRPRFLTRQLAALVMCQSVVRRFLACSRRNHHSRAIAARLVNTEKADGVMLIDALFRAVFSTLLVARLYVARDVVEASAARTIL